VGKDVNIFEWFKYRTFYASNFSRTHELVKKKNAQRLRISLGIPTLNEEKTIARVVTKLRRELLLDQPLLDEIVVIDSGSTDRTVLRAKKAGATVVLAERVTGDKTVFRGKGENLWKSLSVLDGDLIVWLDADIKNVNKAMVNGLVGPLLGNPDIMFVKGFFDRHLKIGSAVLPSEGGRTTEIFVRPFLNMFFPQLAGFIQPLSGQVAGRRRVFEHLKFYSGYGVEIGHLVDIEAKWGLNAMGQSYLGRLVHANHSNMDLGKQAFGILQVLVRRISGYQSFNRMARENVHFVQPLKQGDRFVLVSQDFVEGERPKLHYHWPYRVERFKKFVSARWPVKEKKKKGN
jgi:glucosyl-3-phosphoglycerate synthase